MKPDQVDRPVRPELLAPAGDWEAMRAAAANGADAVYFGLSNFNARHRAANFTSEELPRVMAYLHEHNVRGYLAFNTLIFSDELDDAARFIQQCAAAGVDALIVYDLGLVRLIQRMVPTLPIHGSTQMTLTEPRGIELVGRLGVRRVILARELSMAEVEKIAAATSVPVEVFIHGALCVAYSGQCLTSESLGGRSANRGQCAQACRLPYELIVDGQAKDLGEKAYLLSPQDLAAHDLIGELTKIGVCAFKIEGRLKSEHYVAAATRAYRAALDAALAGRPFTISPEQQGDLTQSFSRGFTYGFLDGVNHQKLVHARFPKSRGIRIGTVVGKTERGLVVEFDSQLITHHSSLITPLKPGDGVVFDEGHPEQDEQGGRIVGVKSLRKGVAELTLFRGDVSLPAIAVGSIVWKTDDPAVRKRLEQSFSREKVVRRVKVDVCVSGAVGGPLDVSMRDEQGHEAQVKWPGPLQRAEKFPLSEELTREQLGRLGQTPFELGDVKVQCDAVMVPKSVLNDLRRQAVEMLMRLRQVSYPVDEPHALHAMRTQIPLTIVNRQSSIDNSDLPKLSVLARTMEQLQAALAWRDAQGRPAEMVYCDFEEVRRYKEAVVLAKNAGMRLALATLRVVKPGEEGLLRQIAECGPDAVLVRNLAAVSFYSQQYPELPMIGDYSLNVANEITASVFAEAGLRRIVPSYDLNWKQLAAMLGRCPAGFFEVVVHQHMPMFHMEHCVFAHTLSNGKDRHDCGRPCERHRVDLRDRVGQAHPLIPDVGCRNTLFNATAQSAAEYVPEMKRLGIRWFRVELLREDAESASKLLDRYGRVLAGAENGKRTLRELRVLNQLGVTKGTLEFA